MEKMSQMSPLESENKFRERTSFLSVNENLETEELSKLSTMVNAMMMTGQGGRKKKRYTEDGRLCASAFAQDGQTFFDCTATRSPDGQNKNKEWCYVDASAKGDKPWDYCKPIMDYDKIREENQEQLKQFSIKARKVNTDIESNISPGQQSLDDLKKVRQGQAELDQKINQLINQIATINNNMQNLFNTKSQWEKEENKAVDLAEKIDHRLDKKKEDEANNQPTEMDKTEDTIKKEIASNKCVIAPFLQSRIISPLFTCEGMLMYEEDSYGDGLVGQYFDNESFLGDYKEQKDPNIDFDWTGASPIEGVNPSNFSVRWEGFIYAPVTANYQFAVECDDGATVTLNNKIIVSHQMYSASSESKGRVDKWLTNEVNKRRQPGKNYNKSTSTHVKLTGGSKFKIVVSYYHSVHDDFRDNEKAFVRLYWQSDEFEETLVSRMYLYSSNSYAPLKVSGFSSDTAVVRKLLENDLAFKNSEEYILQDIPTEFQGSTTLKLNVKHMDKELKFYSNIPVIVYLGRLAHYPNPIPNDFENTGEYMSLLQIKKPNNNQSHQSIDSNRSALIEIHKKKFDAGKILIPLNRKSINVKGIPLIVFFGFDSQISSPISCGGDEMWISDPNSANFKGCSESSFWEGNWKCRNGLNGKNKDTEGSTWASRREGIGAWLNVEFKALFQVSKIKVMNRRNPAERNSLIIATFSNGEEFEMKLKNLDEVQEFKVEPPVKTNFVKFTIKGVYGTINNGASFQVYGTKCIDADDLDKDPAPQAKGLMKVAGINPKSMPALFKNQNTKPVSLTCKDSLSNSKKLDHVKQKPGNKVTVSCLEGCANSKGPVYGDGKYSKDSSICKAAFHAQKLKPEGGLVMIVFQQGENSYKGVNRNGIKTKSKGRSDITLTFESVETKDEIILQTGTKVDVRQDNKWLPGVINQIKDNPVGQSILITIEGAESSSKPIETHYPNKKTVKPCGEKVKDRDCKGSRKNTNQSRPIKIKFVPESYNIPGDYLLDKGKTFGKCGKAYGWSKDMSGRIKSRQGGSKPEMDTLVEFPPDSKSKFCNKPSPDVLCDNVTWSVKVGHGKYNVKLYIGDPQANSKIDLKINDEYIAENTTVPKGELKIFEGAYDSLNEYLTVKSDCKDDCEYAMSKMNMIEIFPFEEKSMKVEEPEPEQKDNTCGNAVMGGKCSQGPDVTHCVFEDASDEGTKFCTGNMLLVEVSKQYRCIQQRGKFKCVKRQYKDQGECVFFCPGKCEKSMCLG
jgi:hypothetical protein